MHKWTEEVKIALKNHFKKYLAQRKTPRQLDCLNAVKKETSLKKSLGGRSNMQLRI